MATGQDRWEGGFGESQESETRRHREIRCDQDRQQKIGGDATQH